MQTIRTAGHRYWNPCGSLLAFLWEKIYKKSGQGRRTGVGITAEGDMLAAMGLRYGTEEATEFLNKYIKQSLWKPIVHLLTWRKNVEHSLSMTVNEKKIIRLSTV